ncbi:beta strand repeat-containing protein [Nonlabens agnitus]|nr:hypothetical protein [Nonlabens agnitus]
MKQFYSSKLVMFAVTFFVFAFAKAQTQNNLIDAPGDIAIVALHSDDGTAGEEDGFSFILLDNAPAGATIRFIDEEWLGTTFQSPTAEGELLWTNNSGSQIAAGTVVNITDTDGPGEAASIGIVDEVEDSFNINGNSDQIYAVTGTRAVPGTFLTFYGTLEAGATLAGTGLTDGINAQVGSVGFLEGRYTGPTTCNGTAEACATQFNTTSNWTPGEYTHPNDVPSAPSTYTGSVFAGNTAPDLGGTPADVTVTEDVATAIDLSAYNITDADGDLVTVTLGVDRGTIASVNGNGTTSGVIITNSGTASMTLQGSVANINTYLNDTSKITYTTALNDTTTATLTVTPNDGTINGTADTVLINVTAVNDDPVVTIPNPNPGVSFLEGGTAVTINNSFTIDEPDGENINLVSLSITSFFPNNGESIAVTAPGPYTANFNSTTGVLTLTGTGTAAQAQAAIRTATFVNTGDDPSVGNTRNNRSFVFTVTDASGNSVSSSNFAFLSIAAINDDPTLSSLPSDLTVTENTASNIDLSTAVLADVDAGTQSVSLTIATSSGTLAASTSGGVTVSNSGTASITLSGAIANINTYLDTASNIQVTTASGLTGNDAAVLTITGSDNGNSGSGGGGTINFGSVNLDIDVQLDDASFSYSAASFCVNEVDPLPTITGEAGGTFSSTAGLSINFTTGAVDVSASTPGTYTVTYTTMNPGQNTASQTITVNALDDASFNYAAAAYCTNDSDPTPTITGLAGGTFSSTAGLSINATTGAVDVSASTPGIYTVTYTTAGACPNSSSISFTINTLDDASFSYGDLEFCATGADAIPTITGLGGGTFSSTAGISINATTGAVDVSASTPGIYTVTYTTAGACPNSSNVSLEITSTPEPIFGNGDSNSINVSITGGCSVLNGIYILNGTINGKNNYEYQADPFYEIGYDGSKWVLYANNDFTNNGYENTTVSAGLNPPSSGWVRTACTDGTMTIDSSDTNSFCAGDTVNDLISIGTGTDIKIYSSNTSTTPLSSTDLLTDGDYYATDTVDGCESERVLVPVTITPATTFTAPADVCIDAGLQTGLSGGTATGGVYSGPGVTDDGNGSTYTFDPVTAGVGIHTIVYTTNTNGCADSASDTIEVLALDDAIFAYSDTTYCTDATDPVPTITGLAGGTFSSTAGLSLNSTTGVVDLSASTPGNYTVTYTTAGTCPNSSTATIIVNGLDDASFAFAKAQYCPNEVDPTPTITGLTGGTFSSSAGLSINTSTGVIDLSASTQGTYTISYTTNGDCPNLSTTVVTIEDNTAPVPDTAVLADVTAECSITALTAPTATDNCGGTVTVTSDAVLPITAQGTTVVTWTFDDGNGNITTQTQNVIIDDTTPPTPDLATLPNVTAQCVVTSLTPPTATDNCVSVITVTNNATLPITTQGTTVITWAYDDGNGNIAFQNQNIIIDDTTPPTPDLATLPNVTAQCVVTSLTPPTASDNCGGMITVTNNATLPITTQGTTVITWAYDDGNGNITFQNQNIIIDDTTPPTPDLTVLADVTAQCSVTSLVAPTATDNCGGTVTVTSDAVLPITTQGTTVVTWTFDDGNGNTSTQTQNVIIDDTTAPVADLAVLADVTAQCSVTSLVAPTATDNCGNTVTVTSDAVLPITTQGTTVVTWTFDDGNGNTSTQTQNVIIDDTTAPVADLAVLADVTAQCSVTSLVTPTATDNCGGTVTVTSDAVLPITTQGTTVVTWTFDDGNGNTSTQTQNVIIDDTTAPVADLAVLADVTAQCSVTSLVAPTATDNCGGTVTVTSDAVLPITTQGTTVVTWTFDDGNGNTSTQTQNVIIDDTTAPVADLAVLADVTAQCSVTSLVAPTATDNCGGTVTVTSDAVLPISTQGTTIVTWTFDDGNGNTTTQTQNVVIAGSDIENATLADATFVYDGSVRSLAVENIPADATVTYTNNDQTEAGTYVVTAVISSSSTDCPQVTIDGILTIEQAEQTVTFDALTRRRLSTDPDFQLTATASSGLPVVYETTALTQPPAADVSATGFVTLQSEGFLLITATQPGNNNYLAATPVSQELEVFLNTDTTIESISINGEVFTNPDTNIFYLIDCDDSIESVDVEIVSETGATASTGESFIVETATPGLYRRTIVITAENGRDTRTFNLLIEKRFVFDAIVEQKYGNVLVVNNNPANNGGYSFVAYEWFKNGRLVSTDQFFSEGDNASDRLDPSARYMVRMTLANGDVLQTCESTINLGNTFSFVILQNPVLQGKTLNVRADYPQGQLENAVYFIYDQNGRLVKETAAVAIDTSIELPDNLPVGVYRLVLQINGSSKSLNFIKN